MIAEALKFLAEIQTPKNPQTVLIGSTSYAVRTDGTLGEVVRPVDLRWKRPALEVDTLSGLCAAFAANVNELGSKVAVLIQSPFRVVVCALDLDECGVRREYVVATHKEESPFPFGKYLEPEPFLLAFRAGFLFNEQAVMVQQLCSTIVSGVGVAVADDGISQEITVKSGTITKGTVQLPADGVSLIPWRTFRDANPCEAKFLLRMKGVKDGLPQIALFEVDAMWKLYLVGSIRKYLEEKLGPVVIIA